MNNVKSFEEYKRESLFWLGLPEVQDESRLAYHAGKMDGTMETICWSNLPGDDVKECYVSRFAITDTDRFILSRIGKKAPRDFYMIYAYRGPEAGWGFFHTWTEDLPEWPERGGDIHQFIEHAEATACGCWEAQQ